MGFPVYIVERAWNRQGGYCAACGKNLYPNSRNPGEWGAWHAHHRKPLSAEGTDSLRNCVLLCINGDNCHLNVGHGGDYSYYAPISDYDLPHLYDGDY